MRPGGFSVSSEQVIRQPTICRRRAHSQRPPPGASLNVACPTTVQILWTPLGGAAGSAFPPAGTCCPPSTELTFPISARASERLQEMQCAQEIERLPSQGPRGTQSQQGFHRWPQEGGLPAEGTAHAGTLSVGSAPDGRSLLSRQEVPFREQTGSQTATGLSQLQAGAAPGCWTVCMYFF